MFTLAFQKSFDKMKLSAVILLRYVPLFARELAPAVSGRVSSHNVMRDI